ncbi:MAG: DNA/RNA nuclease SfsA, partial [Bradymonadia bacterium]
ETPTAMIGVNTHRANALVEEALRGNLIASLSDFESLSREVPYGQERSRVDFLLRFPDRACYVEVKNVTLSVGSNVAAFPDAVSLRGQKHLRELMSMVERGHRAALVYCVSRTDVDSVRAADEVDPVYAKTLKEARQSGVEVYALKIDFDLPHLTLVSSIPVLSP